MTGLALAISVNPTEGITLRSLMAARSSPGGFVVATVTNLGSFMAPITRHWKNKFSFLVQILTNSEKNYTCCGKATEKLLSSTCT